MSTPLNSTNALATSSADAIGEPLTEAENQTDDAFTQLLASFWFSPLLMNTQPEPKPELCENSSAGPTGISLLPQSPADALPTQSSDIIGDTTTLSLQPPQPKALVVQLPAGAEPILAPSQPVPDPAINPLPGPDAQIVGDDNEAAQSLHAEAARRDANLLATYLAAAGRRDREAIVFPTIKPLLPIRRSEFAPEPKLVETSDLLSSGTAELFGKPTFATTLQEAPVDSDSLQLNSQLVNHIMQLSDSLGVAQARSLRLRLRPEELGQIDVRLTRDAQGRVSAHLTAEREITRVALTQSLGELHETLSRAGLRVDQLEVRAQTGFFAGSSKDDASNSQPSRFASTRHDSVTIDEAEPKEISNIRSDKLISLSA